MANHIFQHLISRFLYVLLGVLCYLFITWYDSLKLNNFCSFISVFFVDIEQSALNIIVRFSSAVMSERVSFQVFRLFQSISFGIQHYNNCLYATSLALSCASSFETMMNNNSRFIFLILTIKVCIIFVTFRSAHNNMSFKFSVFIKTVYFHHDYIILDEIRIDMFLFISIAATFSSEASTKGVEDHTIREKGRRANHLIWFCICYSSFSIELK